MLLLLGLIGATRGDAVDLPLSAPLEYKEIEVELRGGQVEIAIDEQREPSIEAHDYLDGAESKGFVVLEKLSSGGLRIGQAYGEDAIAPRLVLRLVVHSDTAVRVMGANLSIIVERAVAEADAEPERDATLTPPISLLANDSNSEVRGATRLALGGRGSSFRLSRVDGTVDGKPERGSIVVDGGRGTIDLAGNDSDYRVNRFDGDLVIASSGGSVLLSGGVGSARLDLDSPNLVQCDERSGPINLKLKSAQARLSHCGATDGPITVSGERVDLTLEQLPGAITLDLNEGSVHARGVAGRVEIVGKHLRPVELAELGDALELRLSEGCEATLSTLGRRLGARLSDSIVEMQGVRELDLKLQGGRFTGGGITGAVHTDIVDGDYSLDISATQSVADLKIGGSARGEITLRDPCALLLDANYDQVRNQLEATQCEIVDREGQRVPQPRRGPTPAQTATLKLKDGARLMIKTR